MTPTMLLAGSTDVTRLLKYTQTLDEQSRASTLSYLAGPVVASTATHFRKQLNGRKKFLEARLVEERATLDDGMGEVGHPYHEAVGCSS